MKFGLMCQIQMPRPWDEDAERHAYRNALDQAVAAERAGFDYFWITEQHFCAEIGHSACPDMMLAALSQRTTRIRLGFAVILLPCHNPFMVAERVATLDVLSDGRAEFGSGRGAYPYIVEGLGFDPAEGREVGRETLEAVLSMYEHEFFPGYKGKHLDLPARYVLPRPIQRPHPPLWVAASNLDTWAHAGRQGVGVLGITHNTPEETKPAIDAYRAGMRSADRSERLGKFDNEHAGAFAVGVCLDDDRTAREVGCAAARWYFGLNDAELKPRPYGPRRCLAPGQREVRAAHRRATRGGRRGHRRRSRHRQPPGREVGQGRPRPVGVHVPIGPHDPRAGDDLDPTGRRAGDPPASRIEPARGRHATSAGSQTTWLSVSNQKLDRRLSVLIRMRVW